MLGELASTASIELGRLGLERVASIESYPTRRLGNDVHVQLRHPAGPFRPTFTISSVLARARGFPSTHNCRKGVIRR